MRSWRHNSAPRLVVELTTKHISLQELLGQELVGRGNVWFCRTVGLRVVSSA